MELNVIHKSLKPLLVKDSHGNYPFWYRCSAIDSLDEIPSDYSLIETVFDLTYIKHRSMDIYGLKVGYIALKHNNKYYRYIFNDNFCDYDIQPYIDRKECWFNECEIKTSNDDDSLEIND